MKSKYCHWLLSGLLIFFLEGNAQDNAGNYQGGFSRKGNTFFFTNNQSFCRIEFCTPSVFRIRYSRTGNFEANESWMVSRYQWEPVQVNATESAQGFLLRTDRLEVQVLKRPFRLEVYSTNGRLIAGDAGGYFSHGDTVGCSKTLLADEHFFGFGERMDFVDQRNKKIKLNVGRGQGRPNIIGAYNVLQANYSPVPFFMSTGGYGIFFHNAWPNEWDMGWSHGDKYRFSASGGELDYYFIYGPDFPDILSGYSLITGRSPLLPRFALGLHLGTYSGGTWGYEQFSSDKYVIELARKLRAMGIPVDLIWLDSTWRIFGKNGGKGATSFEWRGTFKNPKGMFDSLYAMHYYMVGLHLRPRFDNGNRIRLLDTAQKLGFTYPEKNSAGEFVNFFDSASVDFWWKHGVMRVASIGARFLKTDEGSAFGALANESDKIGPSGKDIPRLHNLFPIAYAKAPYEKFQQFNHIRGLNQTREGYAGIQRYPYIFAGDWPSEWQYFAPVIKAGLNIGLSGVGYWAHCMGGFEHDADPELYMRWCQFGMLSPVALVFGMDHPGYKEPWNYGEDALRNFMKYDSLRYCLQPYLYSTAFQQYQKGIPMMRAMVISYSGDPNTYSIDDQYMLGDNLMVCPVTTKGAQTRVVYFPAGDWYDFWSCRKISGNQYLNVVAPADHLPLYIKSGGILPIQPKMDYTDQRPVDRLTLRIVPGNGTFNLYYDDGMTLNYQKGQYSLERIETTTGIHKGSIVQKTIHANFAREGKTVLLDILVEGKPVHSVELDGKKLSAAPSEEQLSPSSFYYDPATHHCYILFSNKPDWLVEWKTN